MAKKITIYTILALAIGISLGYFLGYDIGWEKALSQHAIDETAHDDSMYTNHMQHEQMEATTPVPSVDLVIHKDPKGGYNAQIILTNMVFSPENVSGDHVPGQGHAHIYVNGIKINRVYGEWYYLGELEPGIHEVSVRLSTNNHKELVQDGKIITDIETIEVAEQENSMNNMQMEK